jgi:hypothetical protein
MPHEASNVFGKESCLFAQQLLWTDVIFSHRCTCRHLTQSSDCRRNRTVRGRSTPDSLLHPLTANDLPHARVAEGLSLAPHEPTIHEQQNGYEPNLQHLRQLISGKRRRSANPSRWLFSGWNCVP